VTQEALTNIARHAHVKEANITLTIDQDHLQLSISDSGRGFDTRDVLEHTSNGISGMEERIALAGGTFSLQSTLGEGTSILVEFELKSME
jgi:signal transduction histidine kinase